MDMARAPRWWWLCSYKKSAIAVCFVNLIVAMLVIRSLYYSSPYPQLSFPDEVSTNPFSDFKNSDDQMKRLEESIQIRKASRPVELINILKKLREELAGEEKRWELSPDMKQMLSEEILQRMKGLKESANLTEQREAVESWRIGKLEEVKKMIANATSNLTILWREARMLANALEFDWHTLSEDIGLWIPLNIINKEDISKDEMKMEEEEIIPGRPLPPECHAELHTDYDGAAVRWGLTHHKETAADCCQACLDQAKNAKAGEMKCNIWVYCPLEFGCYSPDKYEHKHQECWLKQSAKPRLNFKDKYSEEYRNAYPTAPVVVPWMSGVISSG